MVDLQGKALVAILTRAPSAGGKTRLFAELGCAPDPSLLSALLLDTLDAVQVPGTTRAVCFTPGDAEPEMRALIPPDVVLLPQRGEPLGDRMKHVFDDLFARGAASVILVGSDLPALDPAAITTAHEILARRPRTVVLGPAVDGGYYLVGATFTPAPLFDRIPWGTARVLAETERRAAGAALHTERLETMADVDTLEDLHKLVRSDAVASRTRSIIAKLNHRKEF